MTTYKQRIEDVNTRVVNAKDSLNEAFQDINFTISTSNETWQQYADWIRQTLVIPDRENIASIKLYTSTGEVEVNDNYNISNNLISKCRRCLVKNKQTNNSVYITYLDDNNSNFYEDGEVADINTGNEGDVMVHIPEFWYKITYEDDNIVNIDISLEEKVGFNKSFQFLTSAFYNYNNLSNNTANSLIGYNRNQIFNSVANTFTTTPTKIANQQLINKGGLTIEKYGAIQTLFLLKYKVNKSPIEILGDGLIIENNNTWTTGTTASLGINDTVYKEIGSYSTLTNFLGIEGLFGGFGDMCQVNNTTDISIVNSDYNYNTETIGSLIGFRYDSSYISNTTIDTRVNVKDINVGYNYMDKNYLYIYPKEVTTVGVGNIWNSSLSSNQPNTNISNSYNYIFGGVDHWYGNNQIFTNGLFGTEVTTQSNSGYRYIRTARLTIGANIGIYPISNAEYRAL